MNEAPPATEPRSPGQTLADARAELKLSVADVSQQIKYGVKQIAAIEADDYDKLPGATFVRGMIRSYAKLVQIDAAPLLADLGRRNIRGAVTVDLRTNGQEPFIEGGAKSNRLYVLLSVAVLVVVFAVAFEWMVHPLGGGEVVTLTPKSAQGDANDAAPLPAGTPTPATAAPSLSAPPQASKPEPAATAGARSAADARAAERPPRAVVSVGTAAGGATGVKRIELDFDELSWVEVKQANGRILLSQLNHPGTRQVVEAAPPFEVVIGNAAKVHLKYDNAPVDLRPYFKVDVARLKLD